MKYRYYFTILRYRTGMYRFIPVQLQNSIYRINVSQVKLLINTLMNSSTQYSAVLYKNSIALRYVMSVIISSINDRLYDIPIHHMPHHSLFSPSIPYLALHDTTPYYATLHYTTTHYISPHHHTALHHTTTQHTTPHKFHATHF